MHNYLEDYVQCRQCSFIGPEGCVIDHYVREELNRKTTPFQCKLCPARFYRKQTARLHQNRDHRSRTATFRHMFWGSLRDLTVDDMVRRPAFLRGNRPGMVCQDAVPKPRRGRDQSRPVARAPIHVRLGHRCSAIPRLKEDSQAPDYEAISDDDNEIYDNIMAGADQYIQGAAAPGSQTSSLTGCPSATEPAAPVARLDPDSRADSGSSDSDSDADDRSDRTTCYKRRPRQQAVDTNLSTAAQVEANDVVPEQPMATVTQPSVAVPNDESMLRDAVLQLTQELTAMRHEWRASVEAQVVIETLKETNKQLQEVNEYHQFLLGIENRRHLASAGLIDQCRATAQRKRTLQQQNNPSGQPGSSNQ